MKDAEIIAISNKKNPKTFTFGDKGLNLRKAMSIGIPVPDGIILSVEFMQRFIKSFEIDSKLSDILNNSGEKGSGIDDKILNLLLSCDHNPEINAILENALGHIKGSVNNFVFAVRSAVIGEDNSSASFAGQYETVLNVRKSDLIKAIARCYSSWWTDRTIAYRKKKNIEAVVPQISVIIQIQLDPEYSGVLFTRNPVGTNDHIIIEAVKGLGDRLVSGQVTPFRWELKYNNGVVVINGAESTNDGSLLEFGQIEQIVNLGRRLERSFGKNLDIEWAFQDGKLYLLQVRPITTLGNNETIVNLSQNHYCRTIIEDLWSDRMTNITSSIVFEEYADVFTFKSQLKRLKLNEIASIPAVKVINGFGYLNVMVAARLLELLPTSFRFREITNSFPEDIREQILKIKPIKKLQLKVVTRLPFILNDLAILPFLTSPLLKRYVKKISLQLNRFEDYKGSSLVFYKKELQRLISLLSQLQTRNQWGYGNAAIITWMTYHLSTRLFRQNEEWILNELTNIPDNVTLKLQTQLFEICKLCDEQIIKEVFEDIDNERAWKTLNLKYHDHIVFQKIYEVIAKYKYRSNNRDFIHPRWDEKPVFVLDHLATLLKSDIFKKNEGADRLGKCKNQNKNSVTEVLLWPMISLSKRLLALREDLRFGLDIAFYRIRKVLIAISENEKFSKFKLPDDWIFYLELKELRIVLDDPDLISQYIEVINHRKQIYESEKDKSPPYYVLVNGESILDLDRKGNQILGFAGIPASPGIVEGIATIIRDSSEFKKLKNGDILIAYNTDPGWTPLFLSAKGVVVEMGGILNHCAIVAREYGIPAIVGVPQVTKLIKDGDRIRVNGFTGNIDIMKN